MSDFRKLEVWQKAHALVLVINDLTDCIRKAKYTSLKSQMIRCAMSIDANIVEGSGQRSDLKFAQFLETAVNSANELEAHLIMTKDFNLFTEEKYTNTVSLLVQVRKMLHGLINKLRGVQKRSN